MPKEDYRWIRTWGELMNSKRSYINDEIRRARASHAPENAIYQRGDGTWATTDDVANLRTRRELGLGEN